MNNNWFECKVSYDKNMENGLQKSVKEPYLVDAMSFTEAEARIIEELQPYMSGEYVVVDIKRARLAELFLNPDGDRYYKAKVNFVTFDEKSGAEKRTAVTMLVQASTLPEAVNVLEKGMKGTQADYEIAAVNETQILDIFPFGDDNKAKVPKKTKSKKDSGDDIIAKESETVDSDADDEDDDDEPEAD